MQTFQIGGEKVILSNGLIFSEVPRPNPYYLSVCENFFSKLFSNKQDAQEFKKKHKIVFLTLRNIHVSNQITEKELCGKDVDYLYQQSIFRFPTTTQLIAMNGFLDDLKKEIEKYHSNPSLLVKDYQIQMMLRPTDHFLFE